MVESELRPPAEAEQMINTASQRRHSVSEKGHYGLTKTTCPEEPDVQMLVRVGLRQFFPEFTGRKLWD